MYKCILYVYALMLILCHTCVCVKVIVYIRICI